MKHRRERSGVGSSRVEISSDERFESSENRMRFGKSLRRGCPRSGHAQLCLKKSRRDPLALLDESNHNRVANLLPIRFERMAESPLAFFRGTAVLQAHDLRATSSAGITVQCCGDCHLMNFGGFATPERTLVFDINDFDETLPGPFEWDLKRLATSFVLAGRWLEFDGPRQNACAEEAVASYRTTMAQFAKMTVLETWYARIAFDDLLRQTTGDAELQKRLVKLVRKARQSTSEHIFHKVTRTKNGILRIIDEPPLVFHPDKQVIEDEIIPFFRAYRDALPKDRQFLFDRFKLVDVASKVVGIGSVGTRSYVALFLGVQGDPLFLQVKEARTSVLTGRAGPSPYAHDGERVVTGQRLMQSASDIFLGWSSGPKGRDFFVRQLRDMKFAPDLRQFTPRILLAYARLCGHSLARAHAKTGDAATISGYLGSGNSFDNAVADYAVGYANQVERDYKSFRAAIRSGRFSIETRSSQVEQAIR